MNINKNVMTITKLKVIEFIFLCMVYKSLGFQRFLTGPFSIVDKLVGTHKMQSFEKDQQFIDN